jgi:integrase
MPKRKLTQRTLETLRPPVTGRIEYRDELLPNFVLRVAATGRKTYTYVYRFQGKQKRAEIGTFPPLTLGDARDMARQVWREVQQGNDPAKTLAWLSNRATAPRDGTPGSTAGPFADVCRRYLDERRSFLRAATHAFYSRLIDRHIVPEFGTKEPSAITRAEVKAWIERLKGTPIQANRAMAVMRLLCKWTETEGIIQATPCAGLQRPAPEIARSRYLNHTEIASIFSALQKERPLIAAYYELLFFTGVRRSKPLDAEWKDIDLERGVWHIPITKRARGNAEGMGRPFIVPLTRQARESLKILYAFAGHSRFVFPGGSPRRAQLDEEHRMHNPQKSLERIRMRSGVDFQIRDIRRTVATGMAEDLGIAPFIIAKVMDHKLPGEAQMGDVYNRYDYLDERRGALAKWCDHVRRILKKSAKQSDTGTTARRSRPA